MKIIAVNGSPRKQWNTSKLLSKALDGAASEGADTELVHLYDLDFKGCTSCFACKLKDGASYGRCAMKDDLSPILDKIDGADGLIIGSPIYFGTVTGETRSFMERLLFQYLVYSMPPASLFTRRIPTAFIYTMNVSKDMMHELKYPVHIGLNEDVLRRTFGRSETLCSYETLQFEDYSRVVFNYFDPEIRRKNYEKSFPEDCRKAFDLGRKFGSYRQ